MSNCKDSGRSWIVAWGTFVLMFIETGVVKSLGVLLPDIREQFASQTWVIGFAIALVPGLGAVTCLLSGAIIKVWTPRTTIAVLALLSAVGLFGSFLATDVYTLMVSFAFTGFSTGTTTVSIGVLPKYFDKHYTIAVTLVSCGMSMGIIIMPVLTQFFLDVYGWRGTSLLLCGISLNGVVCSLVFKPPKGDREEYSLLSSSQKETETAKNVYTWIVESLDMHLFTNVAFVSIVLTESGYGFALTGWLIFIVPHGIDVGFTPYKASAIATAGGIGNIFGICMYPVLEKIMSNKVQLYISMLSMSAALVLDSVVSGMHSYTGMVVCSIVFGFARGMEATTWYAIMKDVIYDDAHMVNALGWSFGAYGLASIFGGFSSGWLFDRYGSYTVSFIVLGSVLAGSLIPQCIWDIWHWIYGT